MKTFFTTSNYGLLADSMACLMENLDQGLDYPKHCEVCDTFESCSKIYKALLKLGATEII